MNQSESGACDLLEQAIRELNEMNNCNNTQQDPILIEDETQDVEILDIFPPRVMKCEKGNQTESVTPPHILRKMGEKKKNQSTKKRDENEKKHAENDTLFITKTDIS